MTLRLDFIGLLGARGAKLAVGLATMFVYARMFGISATYDAWVWSLGIVNAASMILFGPITETIRASYSAIEHQEGRPAAEQYLATVAVMMIGTAITAAVVAVVGLPEIATLFVDEQSEQRAASTLFLYVLAPSLVVSQMVAVLTAHLNCRGKVYPPEIAGLIGGAMGVAFIVAFPALPAAWLLAGGYYIGLATPLLVGASFWPELVRAILRLSGPAFRRHAREALIFSLPLLLPYVLGQVSGLIERQFALQAGTGVLAILSYAIFARNTVQAVFTAALSALAVPALARTWSSQDQRPFRDAARYWAHQCLLLVTVGMILVSGLSSLAPAILFGPNVSVDAQLLLAKLLSYYAIAIIAVVLYLIGGSMLLSARRGHTYALLGAAASATSTLLLVALFPLIGLIAIPVALGLSHLGAAWMMFNSIHRLDAGWVIRQATIRAIVVATAGWMIRAIDGAAHHADVPVFSRLALCLGAAGCLCGVWWVIDRRQAQPNVGNGMEIEV